MGMGHLGGPTLVFKRKFRWTFEIKEICQSSGGTGEVPPHYVKLASRPNISIEETEINYLNAKTWIPGKATWETITVTYYDVATNENSKLYTWLATVYDFTSPLTTHQGKHRGDYSGTGMLYLYDGCGVALELWTLKDVWPQAINFGELDYSSSEEATIELTLRYSQVSYEALCPAFDIEPCCDEDCTTGASGFNPNAV
jgi:hypothetical protein